MKRILQIADMQIEVRGDHQRYKEFTHSFAVICDRLRAETFTHLVIVGDIFQTPFRGQPANAIEQKIFKDFLSDVSPLVENIIITTGNHDIKQKDNAVIVDSEMVSEPSILTTFHKYRNNIQHFAETGFYVVGGITFAVWAHEAKFDITKTMSYSPWNDETKELYNGKNVIELYHDSIAEAKNFDGKSVYAPQGSLSMFLATLVLAGDIHMPDVHKDEKTTFTYCSSLALRDFGEGDKYTNNILTQNNNTLHGYNVIEYTDKDTFEITFVPVTPIVGYHSYIFDEHFDYNDLSCLSIEEFQHNKIKLLPIDNIAEFNKHEHDIRTHFKELCSCDIKVHKPTDVVTEKVSAGTEVNTELNDEELLERASEHINDVIKKTTTVAKGDKEKASELLCTLFTKQYNKVERSIASRDIEFERFIADNFMTMSKVDIDLTKESEITKVTGGNGSGKTTMYYGISFMLCDRHSTSQSMNNKKENLLTYFNTATTKDYVDLCLHFSTTSKYVLKKRISRTWKSDKVDKKAIGWQKNIKNVICEYELTIDGIKHTDETFIKNVLVNDVISFDDLQRLMFINQYSIDSLLQMKPDDLNNLILHYIGLSFFENMLESYDDVKDTFMSNYINVDSTVEAETQKIIDYKASIEDNKELSKEYAEGVNTLEGSSKELVVAKAELVNIKKPVRELSVIQNIISKRNAEIAEHKAKIRSLEVPTPTDIKDEAFYVTQKATLEAEHKELLAAITADDLKCESITSDGKLLAKDREATIKNLHDTELQKTISLETQISDIKLSIQEDVNKLSKEKQEFTDQVVQDTSMLQMSKDSITDTLTKLIGKLSTIDKELTDLKNAQELRISENERDGNEILKIKESIKNKKCHTCNQDLKEDIGGLQDDINNLIMCCAERQIIGEEENTLTLRLEHEHNEISNEKQEIIDKLSKLNESLTKVKNQSFDVECATVVSTYKASATINEAKIQTLLSEIVEIKDRAKEYSETHEDVKVIDSKLSLLRNQLTDLKELTEKNSEKLELADKAILDTIFYLEWYSTNKLNNVEKTHLQRHIRATEIELSELQEELTTSEENNIIDLKIVELEKDISIITEKINLLLIKIDTLSTKNKEYDSDIETCESDIIKITDYKIALAVIKQYKIIIGKKGLPKYIFSLSRNMFNSEINSLLGEVNFRVLFDENSVLQLYDLVTDTYRSTGFSGMERTMMGLSIINMLRKFNKAISTNILFIDEISGNLNDGENAKKNTIDYQECFAEAIQAISKNTKLYIVDHVVKTLGETRRLEFVRTENGSDVYDYNVNKEIVNC